MHALNWFYQCTLLNQGWFIILELNIFYLVSICTVKLDAYCIGNKVWEIEANLIFWCLSSIFNLLHQVLGSTWMCKCKTVQMCKKKTVSSWGQPRSPVWPNPGGVPRPVRESESVVKSGNFLPATVAKRFLLSFLLFCMSIGLSKSKSKFKSA